MGLLDKLKSLLGLGNGQSRGGRSGQANVTVEHEPAPGNEAAVKGTADHTGEAGETESPAGAPSSGARTEGSAAGTGPGTAPADRPTGAETEADEAETAADAADAEATEDADAEATEDVDADAAEEAETDADGKPEADADRKPEAEAAEGAAEEESADEETAEEGADEPTTGEGADEPAGEPVDSIRGIGPTYAGRLESAGIETVADLAAADAGSVAEAAETSESRATDWIEQAQSD